MKKALSVLLCAAMLASMSVTAFAAENTGSSSNTGTDENNPTSITVSGEYKEAVGSDEKVSVDIAWEAMDFTYTEGSKGNWNDKTHSYDNPETGKWSDDTATITIINHSNVGVLVSFKFEGKNGILGTFSKENLSLESADNEKYQTKVEGVYPAPSASTDFGIGSTSPAITQSGSLGTITVTIEADEIDATAMDADTLTAAVTNALNSGKRNLSIRLKSDADVSMTQAIAKGLIVADVEKSTVNLTLSGITDISTYAFFYERADDASNGDGLKALFLPDATSIGDYALVVSGLVSISAPNVTTIGDDAFSSCSSLTTVSLPNATTIGDDAFYSCSSLTTVSLPNATTIGSSAFNFCTDLQSICLPSVTSVGYMAFRHCTSLSSVTFETPITEWGDRVFGIIGEQDEPNTKNITLTLATEQKSFVNNGTNSYTLTETDVEAGANAEFVGYTFKEIIIQ